MGILHLYTGPSTTPIPSTPTTPRPHLAEILNTSLEFFYLSSRGLVICFFLSGGRFCIFNPYIIYHYISTNFPIDDNGSQIMALNALWQHHAMRRRQGSLCGTLHHLYSFCYRYPSWPNHVSPILPLWWIISNFLFRHTTFDINDLILLFFSGSIYTATI